MSEATRELFLGAVRTLRRSTLWWSVALSGYVVLNLAFWPSFENSDMLKSFDDMDAIMEAFGAKDLASPAGYLDGQVFALMLPMHGLEPFLLTLSSVFVPLYGVILGRLGGRRDVASLVGRRRVEPLAVAIWLVGIACFHGLPSLAPVLGASLPTLALTFLLARATRS